MLLDSGKILEFLSDFLPLEDGWSNSWKQFNESVKELEERILFPSAYPDKREMRLNLDFVLERMLFYSRFPWLAGRMLIARVGYTFSLASECGLESCKKLPVLYAAQASPTLYNPSGCAFEYPEGKINNLVKSIRNCGGEADSIFSLITLPDHALPDKTVIIDFPEGCLADNIFFAAALAAAEQIMINPEASISKSASHFLKSHRPAYPVWIEPGDGAESFPMSSMSEKPEADWQSAGYIPFQFLLKSLLSTPAIWNRRRQADLDHQIRNLTEDLIMNNESPQLKEILANMREKLRRQADAISQWLARYQGFVQSLDSQAAAIDSAISAASGLNPARDIAYQHNNDWRIPEQHLLDLVLDKNMKELAIYTRDLAAKGYPYAGILETAKSVLGYGYPDGSIINIDSKLARILCILARSRLGISDREAGRKYAQEILEQKTQLAIKLPEIDYLAGLACCLDGNLDKGARLLRKALKNGSREAGTWLYDLARKANSMRDIKFLAKNLVPAACYDIAIEKNPEPYGGWPLFMLYVSASQNHMEALRTLAIVERSKIYHSRTEEEAVLHRRNSIGIYKRLLQKNGKLESREYYYLGSMLREEKSHQAAHEYLLQSQEAEALCMLGRIYQYGDGVAIDYDMAQSYYEKALAAGFATAAPLLAKLGKFRQKKNMASAGEASYNEKRSYSSSTTHDTGCFLTTATCQVKGFGDDCEVLQAYRRFRDEVLLKSADGAALVTEYYRLAPAIVKEIDERKDRLEIYDIMWKNYLEPGYELVKAQKNIAARELYMDLLAWLLKKLNKSYP